MANKICFFSAQYLPHMGGVENYTYNISKELVKRGNDVIIVTSHTNGQKYHEFCDGIEIYRLPSINLMNGRLPILRIGLKKINYINELKRKKIDIVIINTRFYFLSLFGARFAYKNKIPSMIIEHGTSHLQFENKLLCFIENVYEHLITFFDKKYVKDFYGVSSACNDWLKHFHIEAKGILYNSIDPTILNGHSKSVNKLRKKYKLNNEVKKFCFVGRIIKEKGITELIEAFINLKRRYDNVCLFIAGEGTLLNQVVGLEKENIYYLGRLSRYDVIDLFLESDAFCLPSISEGFSTAVLEAGICNAYIITTERGGSKELIRNENYGSIIKNNSSNLLYNEMEKIVTKAVNIEKCTKKVYEEVISKYTWEHTTDILLEIIRREVRK